MLAINAASSYTPSCINSRLKGSVAWTPGVIASNRSVNTAVTVTGAVIGSSVKVIPPYTLSGMQATAYVDVANSIQIILFNPTAGSSPSFALGNWTVIVETNT